MELKAGFILNTLQVLALKFSKLFTVKASLLTWDSSEFQVKLCFSSVLMKMYCIKSNKVLFSASHRGERQPNLTTQSGGCLKCVLS